MPPVDRRPDRDKLVRGREVSKLRQEGKELVDEDRLAALFMDLGDYLELTEEEARTAAKMGMEILRG